MGCVRHRAVNRGGSGRARGRRGNAIVLGSVGLFIMALGVIATLNIGQAVSERIRLQNAADAAAYSLAAEEARLFNFFAFTNRAHVAHYASAMTVQSYVSYLSYVSGIYGSLRDLIWDAASIYQCICDLNINYPPISPPYCAAARGMSAAGNALGVVVEATRVALDLADREAAELVEALHLLNRAIWRAQMQQGLMINLLLTSGGYPFVEENDEAVEFGVVNGFNALFNQLEFNQVFDRGAGLNFSLIGALSHPSDIWSPRIHDSSNTDEDVEAARSVMTEIANATRHGPPSSRTRDTFLTDRSGGSPPVNWGAAGFGYVAALPARHQGQTRMISDAGRGDIDTDLPVEEIRRDSDAAPEFHTGTIIASDDYLSRDRIGNVGFSMFYAGQSRHVGASVISDEDGGGHYGYDHTSTRSWSQGTMRLPPDILRLVSFNPLEMICAFACCAETEETFPDDRGDDYEDHDDGVHDWGGLAAVPKFNPDPDQTRDYNQPSTWILLNLPPEQWNRAGSAEGDQPWSFDFSMTLGARTVTLDTTPGTGRSALLPLLRGINVVSRGQAYYHRPRSRGAGGDAASNWQEQPSFFNPYWRARLAPVGLKLKQIYDRLVSGEIHAGSGTHPILAGGINLVRNLLGDVFFHTVTSVMTH